MKEILMVGGKSDANIPKNSLDHDTIETNGTRLGKEILRQIKLAQKACGIIIFTGPDFPGGKIRSCINAAISGYEGTLIDKAEAKTSRKVNVEHACKEDILEALTHLMIFDEHLQVALSYEEYLDLGLNSRKDSTEERAQAVRSLHLGKPNAKALFKHLNMLQLHKTDVEKLLGQPYERAC